MTQLKPIRIPSSKISSLLNNISHSFHLSFLCLLCFLFIFNIALFGVTAQQTDSDATISIPFMQWINLQPKLTGNPPPGLKGFAFGYSKDSNLVIIFGGTTPSGSKSGATYLMDLNDYSWKIPSDYGLISQQNPEARSNMIFAVDKSSSYRNAFIIACGEGSGNLLYNDVWAFDFTYKQWTKVENVTGEKPPLMYDSFGGIDTTLATSSQIVQANTLWTSHGTNGTHFFTDLYALFIDGTLSPNINTLYAIWYKFPTEEIGGEIPSGRSSVAGTILPNYKLAMYGGCDKPDGNCATSDSYSLTLGSNYINGKVDSAAPVWSKRNSCLGARSGAAMTMNSNPLMTFPSQAIVYGGGSPDSKAVGQPGEVGVLSADLGNWVRVLPQKDPDSGYPPQRTGAQMIPIPLAIATPLGYPATATSILLFGGESLDGKNNLNDLWILQLNNNATSGNAPQVTSMAFLKCVPEPKQAANSTTGNPKQPSPGANAGNEHSKNGDDSNNFIISKSHVTFSILSFAFLPLAASVIRFGYGSNQKMAIAGLYTIFIVASYATAFYGLAAVYQEKQKLSGHFNTRHGLFGLVLLILLYIFVPIMAVVSLCVSKKYESDLNDDLDNDKGGIGSKLGFLNWRNSESNSKPAKSFEVSRPGNRLVSGGETPLQLPPVSVLKSSDNWMEKRKSVTIVENHPTMSSQGSRNDSLQNDPSSRRTSQSTAVSRSALQTSTTPLSNHSPSVVRRTHHIIAQIVLLLTTIYIGFYIIKTQSEDLLYFYIFIGFMAIIYLIWIIAAWYGHPKGRNSLLVLFMHKIACGKGEINETKQYDFDESGESGAIPTASSNRMRSVRIEDDEMDEEAEQAQLEQDMHNREVVVMTIPKRRLTVVNA